MLLFDLYLAIIIKIVWLIMSVSLTILIIKTLTEKDKDKSLKIELKNDEFDFIFNTEEEAFDCLDFLIHCTQHYGEVSLLDLYEYLDFDTSYTDLKVGWKDLTKAEVSKANEGYLLALPKTETLG